MDLIVKKASALTSDEKIADGVTGIPDNWPIESYPYTGTLPSGFEQMTDVDMQVLKDNNQAAYDAWLQSLRPISPPPAPQAVTINDNAVVTTQFEKRDKTLKLAHGEEDVDTTTGIATILIQIPGTPGSTDGRWLSSGIAFFDVHTPGDKVLGVYFTDEDNILGGGVGTVIGSYTDDEVPEANKGWAIPPTGWIEAEAIGGYGFAPAGFYIKVIAKKAGDSPSGKFYCNFEWGKVET